MPATRDDAAKRSVKDKMSVKDLSTGIYRGMAGGIDLGVAPEAVNLV